jgi:hypothetical protein
MPSERLTHEQILILQTGGNLGIPDQELHNALLDTLLYWQDRSRTLSVERAILRARVDEAIDWLARVTPDIISAIAIQHIHGGTYVGPPVPHWMQERVAEIVVSEEISGRIASPKS